MAKINFQTDSWDGVEGRHHIEFSVNGRSITIDVTDDHVHVIDSAPFVDVDANSCNSIYALPMGSRFSKVHDYHVWVETGRLPPNPNAVYKRFDKETPR